MAEFKQTSFAGGFNLLLDDTRLPVSFKYKEGDTPYDITYNQYRLGINCRSRFDVCQPINSSITDLQAPAGIKQAIVTFGNYIIIFVAGTAWYRLNGTSGWTQINNFSMDKSAPRYWTVAVPVSTTNYGRVANNISSSVAVANAAGGINQIQTNIIAGTFANLPGLLVQDGINQPQFIYIDSNNSVQCRTTQTYAQWSYPLNNTTLQLTGPDNREYVPIGTFMEWFNGILFIVDTNFTYIYRSVSGRPLDFAVNVDQYGQKGGDATTTSYSVGVGGITAMRAMPGNMLFVAAGGASCFSVTLNQTPNAPTIFGEYTFNRTTLFNANCLTERGMIDISGPSGSANAGDSVFIDANGLRSFNAIEQLLNEGRNSVFSATAQGLFTGITNAATVTSTIGSGWVAAINFDNYAIFSVLTVYGYVLVVYDTINGVYQSIDTTQLGNHAVKQFASIAITTLSLFAITDDDRVVQLYSSNDFDNPTVRLGAISTQDPKKELKVINCRAIFANITSDLTVTASLFTNNRLDQTISNTFSYKKAPNTYTGVPIGNDVGTMTLPIMLSFPASSYGWKAFVVLTWTGSATLVSTSISTVDQTPMQSPVTQAAAKTT